MEEIILKAITEVTQALALNKMFELLKKGYTIEQTEKETKKYIDKIIANLKGENNNEQR